ncbi:MAG: aspartate kinase, partial [Balneolales bacterium]
MHILKFGGSSLHDADKIKRAVFIVSERLKQVKVTVVVSALGGVTDELVSLTASAGVRDISWRNKLAKLRKRHIQVLHDIFCQNNPHSDREKIDRLFDDLAGYLQQIHEAKAVSPGKRDLILSYGERASCVIFAAALRQGGLQARSVESQDLIRTDDNFGDADVNAAVTVKLINDAFLHMNGETAVVTGYIGSTAKREITTLGRSGSDYTAGLLGEALKAERVEIWTDVNGVLTADPDIAPTAITIPHLHYSEIAEMAHFGTKVLHPRTVLPLELLKIPIHIKNSLDPEAAGTLISNHFPATNGRLRSVSVKKDIVLIGIKSKGLDRIKQLSPRVLHALSEAGISILFVASASSDYGISVVINASQRDKAYQVLLFAFQNEYDLGLLDVPDFIEDVDMVTVIGESLKKDLGLSGAVLSVLGENHI